MSTRMPIARRIALGESVYFRGKHTNGPSLRSIQFFDIQQVQDIFEARSGKLNRGFALDLKSDLGPIPTPFPEIWMEWQEPSTDGPNSWIDLACSIDCDTGDLDHTAAYVMNIYMTWPSMPVLQSHSYTYVYLDRQGQFVDWRANNIENGQNKTLQDVDPKAGEMLARPLMALSLINCKNVSTSESGRIGLRRTGSEKRRKIPARKIKYHTIILPGGGSQSDGQGGHRATAIHRVRGHFKTFTAERPLLGKHVGTYWWGWQVRGSAENGMVVSDYSLEGAK